MQNKDKNYDASDEETVKKANKQQKRQREQEIADFAWLMDDRRGRRFAYRYLARAGVWQTSFTGNSTTFFNEGRREMGLFLLAEINDICPDKYMLMIQENKPAPTVE